MQKVRLISVSRSAVWKYRANWLLVVERHDGGGGRCLVCSDGCLMWARKREEGMRGLW